MEKRDITGPVITSDFRDPSFVLGIHSNPNRTWYGFATSGNGKNIQLASGSRVQNLVLMDEDALPTVGAWSTGASIEAPDVIQRVRCSIHYFFACR